MYPIVRNGKVVQYDGPVIWSADPAGIQAAVIELTKGKVFLPYGQAREISQAIRRRRPVRIDAIQLRPVAGGNKVHAVSKVDAFLDRIVEMVRSTTAAIQAAR